MRQGCLDGLHGRVTWGAVQQDRAHDTPGLMVPAAAAVCDCSVARAVRDHLDVEACRRPRCPGDERPQRRHRRCRQGGIGQRNRRGHPACRAVAREEGPTPRPGEVFTGQVEFDLALMLQYTAVGVFPGCRRDSGRGRHPVDRWGGRPAAAEPPGLPVAPPRPQRSRRCRSPDPQWSGPPW